MEQFKAVLITEKENGEFEKNIVDYNIDDLLQNEILIEVKYSSLNYKDALSSIGNKGVTKQYPHIPGIDAAGIVVKGNDEFKEGEEVIVTGYDFGMNTSGGFGQYIRVPSKWLVKLPENLTLKEAMVYGTGGFTAAMSVDKLVKAGIKPEDGEILVTGATGGVGSVAISILSKLGYETVAATGKVSSKENLKKIGCTTIVDRKELEATKRPMLKSRFAAVIDTVGGEILSTAIKSVNYGGVVTTCGNAAGHEFSCSVYPFILRGVTLFGIDSVECDIEYRKEVWSKIASEWKNEVIFSYTNEVPLEGIFEKIDLMLAGKHEGRTIINHAL